jgi:vacuolar iron transporter family protein
MVNPHAEAHRGQHAGWLRAAVLGANDGLVSTASLMVGVAASGAAAATVLTAGVAGLVAGALAMAAGEYVSVSSQVDVERADRAKEARELAANPEAELAELVGIYRGRGGPSHWLGRSPRRCTTRTRWERTCAMSSDTHTSAPPARCRPEPRRRPASSSGAYYPLLGLLAPTPTARLWLIVAITLIGLAVTGILGAWIAGTGVIRPALRVLVGGGLAMAVTAMVGQLFHASGI